MRETGPNGFQALVVDAVCARGGFARKLSNRFLIGIPDLLVKLRGRLVSKETATGFSHDFVDYPAFLLEVKQREYTDNFFTLAVSPLQRRCLEAASDAGMPAFVASFMQKDGRRNLWLAVYDVRHLVGKVNPADHRELGNHAERDDSIVRLLEEACERWTHGA